MAEEFCGCLAARHDEIRLEAGRMKEVAVVVGGHKCAEAGGSKSALDRPRAVDVADAIVRRVNDERGHTPPAASALAPAMQRRLADLLECLRAPGQTPLRARQARPSAAPSTSTHALPVVLDADALLLAMLQLTDKRYDGAHARRQLWPTTVQPHHCDAAFSVVVGIINQAGSARLKGLPGDQRRSPEQHSLVKLRRTKLLRVRLHDATADPPSE